MPPERHISSLVVHARPERREEIADRLRSLGCEIHVTSETGKLVVTLEADSARILGDALATMQLLDGVLAATMVFHHAEPPEGLDASSLQDSQAATEVEP